MTKSITPDDLMPLLQVEHFGQGEISDHLDPAHPMPIDAALLKLTLDELTEYEHNPRVQPNAEWDMLCASYLKTGTRDTVLVVTRRPGEVRYFPAAGGNTRLRVLKYLWEETSDERFYRVNCRFIPFTDEKQIFVAHLTENDNRAEYVFIDRAEAVCRLHEWLQEDHGGPLSQRAFIERMIALGYPKLSQRHLIRYRYAVRLHAYIPMALDAGLGPRAMDRIYETQKQLGRFLEAACPSAEGVEQKVADLWPHVLADLDSADGIEPERAVSQLFEEMGAFLSDQARLGREDLLPRLQRLWRTWKSNPKQSVSLRHGPDSPPPRPVKLIRAGAALKFTPAELADDAHEHGLDVETNRSSNAPGDPSCLSNETTAPLKPNHQSAPWPQRVPVPDLARTFAHPFGLDGLVFPSPQLEAGFGIDLPPETQSLDEPAAAAWWWLFFLSGMDSPRQIGALAADQAVSDCRWCRCYQRITGGEGGRSRETLEQLPDAERERVVVEELMHIIESTVPRPEVPERTMLDWAGPVLQALFDLTLTIRSDASTKGSLA